jgi:PDZ domain-containing protein
VAGSSVTVPSMADMEITTDPEAAAFPPPPGYVAPAGKRRRWPIVLLSLVVLLGATSWVLSHWHVNYYAITPGDAQPVAPLIDVPAHLDHRLSGNILLTDVYVQPLTALGYLQERYFSSVAQVISSEDLLGPSTPADQFLAQGYLEMTQAQQAATAAALNHLGYTVSAKDAGALIYGIEPGSPASGYLKVAQVILGVDYTNTPTACGLVSALHGLRPGSVALLKLEKSTISASGVFEPGPIVEQKVTLGTPPKGLVETGCGPSTVPTAYLGIQPENQYSWHFPVNVEVHTADIGGPSAGLAMTLGIIDKLSGGRLTGGRIVAATGTIDPAGDVGDVGGVAQKTIAVERAGATVFFVPPQELAAARSKDTAQLHVYAVSTLDQALRILERLGGTLKASHQPAQAAP